MLIGAIDVGAPRNIGWAIIKDGEVACGTGLNGFISIFAEQAQDIPAALGFEAPLFIPRRTDLSKVTAQRDGEAGRPWSAGAGATVTTIGIAIVDYTLSRLRERLPHKTATLDWEAWCKNTNNSHGHDLLIWEAFVSADSHGAEGEHWRDALTAARGFEKAYPDLSGHNAIDEDNVISLVGASLIRTGWVEPSRSILAQPCLVIKPYEIAKG